MIRYLTVPQLVFNDDIEQYAPASSNIDVQEIYDSSMKKHCIVNEEYLRNITGIYPQYPFKNKRKNQIYDDLSVIEITLITNTGIINTAIKNIPMTPQSLMELINKQINLWDKLDMKAQMKFEKNLLKFANYEENNNLEFQQTLALPNPSENKI